MVTAAVAGWAVYSVLAAGAQAAPAEPSDRLIQIGIIRAAEELAFTPEGKYRVEDAEGRVYALASGKRYLLETAEKFLKLGALSLPAETRLAPESPSNSIRIGERRYPGRLIIRLDPAGTLSVVDELRIEDYLLGVLPHEMDPSWPVEALKAQAVVARTFAYTQLGKYKHAGFDLTSDTRSQVYGGLGGESRAVRRAVQETRGEVLGYKGKILPVYYHACCGGRTNDSAAVWGGESFPPLRGVRDKYCRLSPLAHWTAYFATSDVLAALAGSRLVAGAIKRFDVNRYDRAGYAIDFLVKVGAERLIVKAADFRSAIGNTDLRSTRITAIRRLSKGVEFTGSGSGHGVGLCQWGARLQADKGRTYEKILDFYFPGSTLSVIDE